jgi:ubiquitin carboxyl-terminal hydrolase 2
MSFNKYSNKGLNGLANLGNTCFMNSVLQCLAHTYELFDIEQTKLTENIYDVKIWNEYFKLVHFMWKEDSTISPNGFLKYVQFVSNKKNIEMFTGFEQNDFSEFLLFMLNCFHESVKEERVFKPHELDNTCKDTTIALKNHYEHIYKNDYSKLTELFCGIQINTVYDERGSKLNTKAEQFNILSVPIPEKNNITLIDCLDDYFKEIHLNGDDKYVLPDSHENAGNKVDAVLSYKIWYLPKILIINILRVKISKNSMRKNEADIQYIETLNLDNYCINKGNNTYELYAIGEHHGKLHGGHYTCLVKNANKKWYRFNDTQVKEVHSINSNRAYTFFYRKKL